MSTTVNIARDFSRNPAGRYLSDGPFSGEKFRDEVLKPALDRSELVEVELDGALSFGSSFLEEAFGGLVRVYGMSLPVLKARLRIHTRIKTYEDRIWKYVKDAKYKGS